MASARCLAPMPFSGVLPPPPASISGPARSLSVLTRCDAREAASSERRLSRDTSAVPSIARLEVVLLPAKPSASFSICCCNSAARCASCATKAA